MKKWGVLIITFLSVLSTVFGQSAQNDKDSLSIRSIQSSDYFYIVKNLFNTYREVGPEQFLEDIENSKIYFNATSDEYHALNVLSILDPILSHRLDEATSKLEEVELIYKNSDVPLTHFNLDLIRGKLFYYKSHFRSATDYYDKCSKILDKNPQYMDAFSEIIYPFMANAILKLGQYEQALEIYFKQLEIHKTDLMQAISYNNIAICYHNLKQYDKAEEYYKKSVDVASGSDQLNFTANLSILYIDLKEFEKANSTINSVEHLIKTSYDTIYFYSVKADLEKHKGNYKESISYFDKVIAIDSIQSNYAALANDYLAVGSVYFQKGEHDNAEQYFSKSQSILDTIEDLNAQIQLLESRLENKLARVDEVEGLEFFDRYISLQEELNSSELRLVSEEMHARYQLADKEAKIATQQLRLEKEAFQRQLLIIGIVLFAFVISIVFFWLRSRHKRRELIKENSLLALQRELNGLELNSLNNQLNPHEVKNLLASISPQIQEKAPEAYQKMLKLFNITKAGLQNDTLTDSLSNQLKQATDYVDLMKDVLWEPLEFEVQNNIEFDENVVLPRLLLKNLVENSVKHGIKGKEEGGRIEVKVDEDNDYILLSVKDNGKGLHNEDSEGSQIGISTYQRLFEVLNKRNKLPAKLEIIEKSVGFEVVVKIPRGYQYH